MRFFVCLQVLLQHGKQQSVEMDAAGSIVACVETGAPIPCLSNIAGGGMQVEDDLGGLDDAQVAERCSKRRKEDIVAKEMLTRCAEDATGRAIKGFACYKMRRATNPRIGDRLQKLNIADNIADNVSTPTSCTIARIPTQKSVHPIQIMASTEL